MERLTPDIVRKLNKKHGWGMCTPEYTRFRKALPEGIEVNRRNLTELREGDLAYAVKWISKQMCYTCYDTGGICMCYDYKDNPARFVKNLSKLIRDAQPKPRKVAAK